MTTSERFVCENGHVVEETFKFCPLCGLHLHHPVSLRCPSGHICEPGDHFCPGCGVRIRDAEPPAAPGLPAPVFASLPPAEQFARIVESVISASDIPSDLQQLRDWSEERIKTVSEELAPMLVEAVKVETGILFSNQEGAELLVETLSEVKNGHFDSLDKATVEPGVPESEALVPEQAFE